MARQYPALTAECREALERFAAWSDGCEARRHKAKSKRRAWRDVLAGEYWPNARIWSGETGREGHLGSLLHSVRNWFGPEWLYGEFRLPSEPKVMKHKGW